MRRLLVLLVLPFVTVACSSLPNIYTFHDPLTPEEHLALGVSYEAEGNTHLAITEYEKALEHASMRQRVTALVFLGNIHAGQEQFDRAEHYYREALSLDPRRGQALNNLASLYVKQGVKLGEAETLVRAALAEVESEPHARHKPFYLETLGEILLRQGRQSEALENFQKAEALNDNSQPYWLVQLYTHMAAAYEGLGQRGEAQQARERAKQLRGGSDASRNGTL